MFVKCICTLLLWDAAQLPAGIRVLQRQQLHSELHDDALREEPVLD